MTPTPPKQSLSTILATGKYKIGIEEIQLPRGVDGKVDRPKLLELIGDSLSQGKVQKIVVEADKPVRIERLVPVETEVPAKEAKTLLHAARNADMQELKLSSPGIDPYKRFFQAFTILSRQGLMPLAVIVNNLSDFKRWLGLSTKFELGKLYGVEILESPEVPAFSCIVLGATSEDPEFVAYGLRVPID